MSWPSIFAYCCTFGRPQAVANIIWQWERMEYDGDKELLILDDGHQYRTQLSGETWSILSLRKRFNTFGEKQNVACSYSTNNHDLIMVVEDDDFYTPWTLHAHAIASYEGELLIPQKFFMQMKSGELRYLTNKRLHDAHAGWSFSRELFRKVNGYPWIDIPTDFELYKKFVALGITPVDTTAIIDPYLVSRSFSQDVHLSKIEHKDPWAEAGRLADLQPIIHLPDPDETRDYVEEMCEASPF